MNKLDPRDGDYPTPWSFPTAVVCGLTITLACVAAIYNAVMWVIG